MTANVYEGTTESAQHSFSPLQKSRRNHRSYVRTEALPGMVVVTAEKLFGTECYHWCVGSNSKAA